jgi:hypothetical protein
MEVLSLCEVTTQPPVPKKKISAMTSAKNQIYNESAPKIKSGPAFRLTDCGSSAKRNVPADVHGAEEDA